MVYFLTFEDRIIPGDTWGSLSHDLGYFRFYTIARRSPSIEIPETIHEHAMADWVGRSYDPIGAPGGMK